MSSIAGSISIRARLLVVSALVVLTAAIMAAPASADFGIASFDGGVFDAGGNTYTQAGGHPRAASVQLLQNATTDPDSGGPMPDGQWKDIHVDLPPGLIGNPSATPVRCTAAQLRAEFQGFGCPVASQVGVARLHFPYGFWSGDAPIFNMVPEPGAPAQFGFSLLIVIQLKPSLRTGDDYGVTVSSLNTNTSLSLTGVETTFWGVPADPANDFQRFCDDGSQGCSTDAPRKPFLTLPSSCPGPVETGLRMDSWQNPGVFDSASFLSHDTGGNPVGATGCDTLEFDPETSIAPTSKRTDSPTGLDFDLSMDQGGLDNPDGTAPAHVKRAEITLPEGMSVNPSSVDGLQGCSEAQIALDSDASPTCPQGSKVGTVEVETPLLEEGLEGSVYLAEQGKNPFNSLLALYLVAENRERGLVVKLPGEVSLDPQTGRLTTTFDNNPQVPFSNLSVKFKSGARAPLTMPSECGTYTIHSVLTSWAGQTVESDSRFTVDQGCGPRGFAPDWKAGSVSPVAGGFSPFVASFSRDGHEQFFNDVSVDLPKGMAAKLKGVPLCASAQADAGTCPADTRIGSATVGAGAGSSPFYLANQPVYLTEGYKGAPYGLAVVSRVLAGPFDLGTVVVRQAIHVDPATAELSVVSDPFPRILQGVPLNIRDVRVSVDRPQFSINPTSCTETQIAATLTSTQGAVHRAANRFQAADCTALSFTPKLSLALTGKKQVTTGKHPGVKALVTQKGIGAAGIKKAVVKLPKALALDPDNAQALCEFVDGTKPDLEKHCPAGSIVGRARAVSPLLNKPLSGNVYFVKNVRIDKRTGNQIRTLPMIIVALRGEIAINLKGESSTTRGGQLVNTFAAVPDAPVTKFNLNIKGGSNGILAVTRTAKSKINLCNARRIAEVDLDGHNGKQADYNTRVKTPCAKKAANNAKRK